MIIRIFNYNQTKIISLKTVKKLLLMYQFICMPSVMLSKFTKFLK